MPGDVKGHGVNSELLQVYQIVLRQSSNLEQKNSVTVLSSVMCYVFFNDDHSGMVLPLPPRTG